MYQLKQARSYTKEHLNNEGKYHLEIIDLEDNIIRIKYINSRHLSQTIWNTLIQYSDDDQIEPIKSWPCDCKNGARTAGC